MARAVTLGNGNLLVGLDYDGQLRDLYFPYVGHSNHVSGASGSYLHRIGVFADGKLRWLNSDSFKVSIVNGDSTLGSFHAVSEELGISITTTDAVHNEVNVFLRSLVVGNEKNVAREVKIFFSQQFRISESRRGDTAFFDPRVGAIIHYKGHNNFLINCFHKDDQFKDYSVGLFDIEGKEGTYHDAEDGVLERNPIEHGSVDSVIGMTLTIDGGRHEMVHYYVACGSTIAEVHKLDAHVKKETPEVLIRSTENYWKAWTKIGDADLSLISPELKRLYYRSLTTIRMHTDNRGAIIASSDTDMLHHGRDTYSYVWPRDASIIANALDRAGYHDVAKNYFSFIAKLLEPGGYLMHKYRSDGVLGSSWHPWSVNGEVRLPIQEDETALTIFMLYRHYEYAKNIEFIESMYNPFIEPAANFLCDYVESAFGLPQSSYDLWEEKYGISTYTASAVYGALIYASRLADVLGKQDASRTYLAVAQRMRLGILEHLYAAKPGMFLKLVTVDKSGDLIPDSTIDISSFFGPIYFGVLPVDDERVRTAAKTVEDTLKAGLRGEGFMRYEGDNYYKMRDARSPNPWVITTLWMAQYYIARASKVEELKPALLILEWTAKSAGKGGVLPEQMHPDTSEHLSTAPLIWSHAEFVITVLDYVAKQKELDVSAK